MLKLQERERWITFSSTAYAYQLILAFCRSVMRSNFNLGNDLVEACCLTSLTEIPKKHLCHKLIIKILYDGALWLRVLFILIHVILAFN